MQVYKRSRCPPHTPKHARDTNGPITRGDRADRYHPGFVCTPMLVRKAQSNTFVTRKLRLTKQPSFRRAPANLFECTHTHPRTNLQQKRFPPFSIKGQQKSPDPGGGHVSAMEENVLRLGALLSGWLVLRELEEPPGAPHGTGRASSPPPPFGVGGFSCGVQWVENRWWIWLDSPLCHRWVGGGVVGWVGELVGGWVGEWVVRWRMGK